MKNRDIPWNWEQSKYHREICKYPRKIDPGYRSRVKKFHSNTIECCDIIPHCTHFETGSTQCLESIGHWQAKVHNGIEAFMRKGIHWNKNI